MGTHITVDQLEKMKTHELADLLANVVLLLRRLPDVECKQLMRQDTPDRPEIVEQPISLPVVQTFTREELAKKKVDELKLLAKELNVLVSKAAKKDDLINKILARSADGRSEQRAILNL